MNSLKTVRMIITVTALIILVVSPIQSMSTHGKRWTFNTWRLHGSRNTPQASTLSTTEPASSTIAINVEQLLNDIPDYKGDDGDRLKILLNFERTLEKLRSEEKEKNDGNNQM
ncbi:hypothetical protein I4U23_006441 [Adineta vaga]|nr:hypothetical protein I4U23_006441 [Adineta vaga]